MFFSLVFLSCFQIKKQHQKELKNKMKPKKTPPRGVFSETFYFLFIFLSCFSLRNSVSDICNVTHHLFLFLQYHHHPLVAHPCNPITHITTTTAHICVSHQCDHKHHPNTSTNTSTNAHPDMNANPHATAKQMQTPVQM